MTPLYPVALVQLDAPDILPRAPEQITRRHTEHGERVMCVAVLLRRRTLHRRVLSSGPLPSRPLRRFSPRPVLLHFPTL